MIDGRWKVDGDLWVVVVEVVVGVYSRARQGKREKGEERGVSGGLEERER